MKRTTEDAIKYFKERNCELLSPYTGCMSLMKYRCSCGREAETSWNSFTNGNRCGYCGKNRVKKYTIEEVRGIFNKRGCNLITDQYLNQHQLLEYKCSCGNESQISLFNFIHSNKYNCVICAAKHCKEVSVSRRLSQEKVEKEFVNEGCTLLSQYRTIHDSVEYICKCGRTSKITIGNFRQGKRCGRCGNKRAVKFTLEEIKQIFNEAECVFLDDKYINNTTPHKFRCSCGTEEYIKIQYFQQGVRCSNCKKIKRSGVNHFAWRHDREQLASEKLFIKRVHGMLHRCYKKLGTSKETHSHQILGYTPKELQSHIMNHPNWEIVKNDKWHIDHIFPIIAFIDHNIYDLRLINCLDNLQPLTEYDNISKNDNYISQEFLNWLNHKFGETLGPTFS